MSNQKVSTIREGKIRFNYLDGVRGVAALIVVVFHFRKAFYDISKNSAVPVFFWEKLKLFFFTGDFSVQLFFVLSGFVLAYNSFNRGSFLKKQWFKRYYRLFVPVFLSSVIYYLFTSYDWFWFDRLTPIYSSDWVNSQWKMDFTVPQFLFRFIYSFMLFADWQFIMNVNSSLWTIPIELYWSYILFICFVILKTIKKAAWKNIFLAGAMLFIIRFIPVIGVAYGILFLAGALLALNFQSIRSFFLEKYKVLLLVILISGYVYIVARGWLAENDSFPFRWSYFAAILFILLALVSTKVQRLFSFSFIQWLGRISFALYLLHLLVIGSLSAWLYIEVPFFRYDAGLVLLLFITIIVCLGISHLFTKYVDEPLMNLFDVYYKKLSGLRSKSLVAQHIKLKE